MWRMFDAMQIDLPTAVRDGDLSTETLGTMMRVCTFCCEQDLCRRFLDASGGSSPAAPGYCPLAPSLKELKKAFPHRVPAPNRACCERVNAGQPG